MVAHQWPLLILFIVLFFQYELRKAIIILAWRISSIKSPFGDLGLPPLDLADKSKKPSIPEKSTETPSPEKPTPPYSSSKWNNINDIYWLGHDLMWTIDVVYRLAPKKYIIHGLKQSLYHLGELPVDDIKVADVKAKLERLKEEAENRSEEDWTPVQRAAFAEKLRLEIIDEVSRITERVQRSPQGSPIA